MSSKLVLVGGLFIGAALAVLYWPSQRNPAPVTPTPEHRQPPVAPTPKTKPEPVKAQVAPPAKAPTSPVTKVTPKPGNDVSADRIRLPDGTSVPVLNGAYGAPAMPWPNDVPWSPVVGKETDTRGMEWYVHQDGSKSITRMVYHSQEGRYVPTTDVFNPKPALPMEPNEKKAMEEAMRKNKASEKSTGQPGKGV